MAWHNIYSERCILCIKIGSIPSRITIIIFFDPIAQQFVDFIQDSRSQREHFSRPHCILTAKETNLPPAVGRFAKFGPGRSNKQNPACISIGTT